VAQKLRQCDWRNPGAKTAIAGTLRPALNWWRMPRYFFHLEGREERIADRRGQILTDEAAALREANLVAAALRTYRGEAWRVIVANEWGHEVTRTPTPLEATA
jgi:uncharacterized protein DUF6894